MDKYLIGEMMSIMQLLQCTVSKNCVTGTILTFDVSSRHDKQLNVLLSPPMISSGVSPPPTALTAPTKDRNVT